MKGKYSMLSTLLPKAADVGPNTLGEYKHTQAQSLPSFCTLNLSQMHLSIMLGN